MVRRLLIIPKSTSGSKKFCIPGSPGPLKKLRLQQPKSLNASQEPNHAGACPFEIPIPFIINTYDSLYHISFLFHQNLFLWNIPVLSQKAVVLTKRRKKQLCGIVRSNRIETLKQKRRYGIMQVYKVQTCAAAAAQNLPVQRRA